MGGDRRRPQERLRPRQARLDALSTRESRRLLEELPTPWRHIMAKRNATLLIGVCFALAACADGATDRGIAGPAAEPSLDVGGPADLTPVDGDESFTVDAAPSAAEAATGGRASGHFELAAPFLNIFTERYSFIALSTAGFPNAKGQLEGKITSAGRETDIHIAVDCLVIMGNQAWASGIVTRRVTNGIPQPTGTHVQWRVQDNGEGANSPPDLGSVLFNSTPQGCRFRLNLPMTPTASGNIQVSQK